MTDNQRAWLVLVAGALCCAMIGVAVGIYVDRLIGC